MSIVVTILLVLLILFGSYRFAFFRLAELPAWAAPLLFLTKLVFGLALWAVYTFYYTDRVNSDIYKFYDDAVYVHQAFLEDKTAFMGLMSGSEDSSLSVYTSHMKNWQRNFNNAVPFNENRFMIRLNALMFFVSGGNIHVHTVFFCLFSFIGCILLLQLFQSFAPPGKKKWMLLTMLLPSFLFWTSGGLKESVIVLGVGLLFYGFLHLRSWKPLVLLSFIGGLLLLLLTKYFLLLCLLPALMAYHLFPRAVSGKFVFAKYTGVLLLCLMLLAAVAPLSPKTNFAWIIAKKQKHAIAEAMYMKAGSYSEVPIVKDDLLSIVKSLPSGLWNALMKPYLWQSRNPMMLLSAAENFLMLILLLLALIYRDKEQKTNYNLVGFMLVAILVYFSIIGIMTPVLGNLVRYRVILMPLLAFLLLYVAAIPMASKASK